jgi:putative endonuclease
MNYFVYAINSEVVDIIYVGVTNNIEKRLKEHNAGKTKSTKGFRPWKLIFTMQCETREEARKFEKYYKGGSGKEKLKRMAL